MKLLALDIGGTFIKYGIFHGYDLIMEGKKKSEGHLGGAYIVKNVDEIIEEVRKDHQVEGIAISTAGVVDVVSGEIVHAGSTIPNYKGFTWKSHIRDKYDLDCQVENDVNCAGLSEYLNGAAKGEDLILCLAIGTGIGASFIKDGKIYHGASNSACEVGYLNIDGKEFQKLASTTALVNYYRGKSGQEEADGKIIFDLAKKKDPLAIESIDYMIDNLARGIANISFILNPRILVLGGGVMEQEEYLRDKIEEKLDKYMIAIARQAMDLRFAKNGNLAGTYGALYHYYQMRKEENHEMFGHNR